MNNNTSLGVLAALKGSARPAGAIRGTAWEPGLTIKNTGPGTGTPFTCATVDEFAQELGEYANQTHEKGSGPIFNLAVSNDGSHRDASITEITGLTFDADHASPEQLEAFADALEASGLAYVGQHRLVGEVMKAHYHVFFAEPMKVTPASKAEWRSKLAFLYAALKNEFGIAFDVAIFGAYAHPVFAYTKLPGEDVVVETFHGGHVGADLDAFLSARGYVSGGPSSASSAKPKASSSTGASTFFDDMNAAKTDTVGARVKEALASVVAFQKEAQKKNSDLFPLNSDHARLAEGLPLERKDEAPRYDRTMKSLNFLIKTVVEQARPLLTERDGEALEDALVDHFEPAMEAMEAMDGWKHAACLRGWVRGSIAKMRSERFFERVEKDYVASLKFADAARRREERETSEKASAPLVTDAEYILSTKQDPPTTIYRTGAPPLDSKLGGGLKSGQVTALVGATGSGKTAFAQNVALEIARSGVPVLWVASELTRKTSAQRFAAIASGGTVDIPTLELFASADKVHAFLDGLSIYTISFADLEESGDPAALIETRAKEIETLTGKKPVVVVDYLQDLSRAAEEKIRMVVGGLSKRLRHIATRNNWAVVIVSSTSRANHLKSDGKPISFEYQDYVTFAKESGDIEYDAATLMVLISMPQEDPDKPKDAFLMVAKHRGGEYGPVGFTFQGRTGMFVEDPTALERIQAKSAGAQKHAASDKREAILGAVAQGATTKNAIFFRVRGSKPQLFKRIDEMIREGELKQTVKGGITIPAGPSATPADEKAA